jgi:non-ribosomal peptide synthetase component E (peptide arylation enzyme)
LVCSGPTLDGVVPFPADYMARYRQAGYWEDRPLISHFVERFDSFPDRTANRRSG